MDPVVQSEVLNAVNNLLDAAGKRSTVEELMEAQRKVDELLKTLDKVIKE